MLLLSAIAMYHRPSTSGNIMSIQYLIYMQKKRGRIRAIDRDEWAVKGWQCQHVGVDNYIIIRRRGWIMS
jgi:hypothetical protein